MAKKQKQWSEAAEKFGKACYFGAMKEVGDMWRHFSPDMHWAFVSKHILALLQAQDESISDARVRELMNEVTEWCRWYTYK